MPAGVKCPACGEEDDLTLTTSETGKGMVRKVYTCNVCGEVFAVWVEKKHQKFTNEQ